MQDHDNAEQVVELELALLHPDVRQDPRWVEELLDEDFREIGASGRLWNREETMEALGADRDDEPVAVADMDALQLAEVVLLLTYTGDRAGRRARRSSIWRRTDGRWRLAHHQGTPVPPEQEDAPGFGSPPDAD